MFILFQRTREQRYTVAGGLQRYDLAKESYTIVEKRKHQFLIDWDSSYDGLVNTFTEWYFPNGHNEDVSATLSSLNCFVGKCGSNEEPPQ